MALMFYLLDKDFNIKRVIENYKSAIWTERFYECGDFELYIPATPDIVNAVNFDAYGRTQYIVRADDTTKCGMIEAVKIDTDADQGNFVTVSGRLIEGLIFRRVVSQQLTYNGSAALTVQKLLEKSIISPENAHRTVANFLFKNSITTEDSTMANQYNGENVGEAIEAICKTLRIGYRAAFDIETKEITFELYQGTDRTVDQRAVPPVVFSYEFNNLLSSSLTVSVAPWKNTAIVLGEGEGTNRQRVVVGGTDYGIERRELYVNAQQQSTNGEELTPSTYHEMLWNKGLQACGENRPERNTEADVAPNYGFILNRDYYLGDLVSVENEYGMKTTPRVVETIEAQDENGYSIIPTFSIA